MAFVIKQGNKVVGRASTFQKAVVKAYEKCLPDTPNKNLSTKQIAKLAFDIVEE